VLACAWLSACPSPWIVAAEAAIPVESALKKNRD